MLHSNPIVSPVAPSDAELVLSAQQGDHDAFEELVQRYRGRVYAQTLSIMRREPDALDATQNTFLNVWRKLHTFRGDASFSSWLYRIAHNACLMILRKRRRRPELPLVLASSDDEQTCERQLEDPGPLAEDTLRNKRLLGDIQQAVGTLSETYRQVFLLADVHGLSMKEIAEKLSLTVPNVKTRLHRARLKLRDQLDQHACERAICA